MTSRFMVASIAALAIGFLLLLEGLTWAADKAMLRPLVPRDQIEAARVVANPLSVGDRKY